MRRTRTRTHLRRQPPQELALRKATSDRLALNEAFSRRVALASGDAPAPLRPSASFTDGPGQSRAIAELESLPPGRVRPYAPAGKREPAPQKAKAPRSSAVAAAIGGPALAVGDRVLSPQTSQAFEIWPLPLRLADPWYDANGLFRHPPEGSRRFT